jgi:hypothetical protein
MSFFIGLESESAKFVKIDWRSIITLTKNITHALVSRLNELWLLTAQSVAKRLRPECPPLLRAVNPLSMYHPYPAVSSNQGVTVKNSVGLWARLH